MVGGVEKSSQVQSILSFSNELFFRYGYSGITIDEIAAKLHISKTTFYRFFSSKEELLDTVVSRHYQTTRDAFSFGGVQSVDELREEYRRAIAFMGKVLERLDARALQDIRASAPRIWSKLRKLQHEAFSHIFGLIISRGIENGVLRSDVKVEEASELLAASIESLHDGEALEELELDRGDTIRSLVDLLFDGMLARTSGLPAKD